MWTYRAKESDSVLHHCITMYSGISILFPPCTARRDHYHVSHKFSSSLLVFLHHENGGRYRDMVLIIRTILAHRQQHIHTQKKKKTGFGSIVLHIIQYTVWIREETKIKGITEIMKLQKWTWEEYVVRGTDNRRNKRLNDRTPWQQVQQREAKQDEKRDWKLCGLYNHHHHWSPHCSF